MQKLIGPFRQLLPLTGLALKGALRDGQLEVIGNGGVIVERGLIRGTGDFDKLYAANLGIEIEETKGEQVLLPGFVDCHTHLCFAGHRANDYALRSSGSSYQEIAKAGGGIWDTVTQTRATTPETLAQLLLGRVTRHLAEGVTTIEVKSGYGLSVAAELQQLEVVRQVASLTPAYLVPTCLAAHVKPKDFDGPTEAYLQLITDELLPEVKRRRLAGRVDIFVEGGAFDEAAAFVYLGNAKQMGFDITVHADQFTTGGSAVGVMLGAASADHLEASKSAEIKLLAESATVAVVLPGASFGLGMAYAPARKLLDAGACLALASDWNPGSAPMGDLLMQAAVLGAAEKLTAAEVFAGLTFRAAHALRLSDRGSLAHGQLADMQAYPCADYREILYYQGKLKPVNVWVGGVNTHAQETNQTLANQIQA